MVFALNTSLAFMYGGPTNNDRLYYEDCDFRYFQRKLKSNVFDSRFGVSYVPGESKSNLTTILGADLSFKNKEDYDLPDYSLLDVGISSSNIKIFGEQETRFTLKYSNLLGQQYVESGFLGIDVLGLERQIVVRVEQNF